MEIKVRAATLISDKIGFTIKRQTRDKDTS